MESFKYLPDHSETPFLDALLSDPLKAPYIEDAIYSDIENTGKKSVLVTLVSSTAQQFQWTGLLEQIPEESIEDRNKRHKELVWRIVSMGYDACYKVPFEDILPHVIEYTSGLGIAYKLRRDRIEQIKIAWEIGGNLRIFSATQLEEMYKIKFVEVDTA